MSEDRGIAIRVGIGAGDMQIELTAIVPEAGAEFLLDRTLDRLTLAGKRQKAIYELADYLHQKATKELLRNDKREELVAFDAKFEAETDIRAGKRNEIRDRRGELIDRYQAEWTAEGKRGAYELRGGQKGELAKHDQAIVLLTEQQSKANEEHLVERTKLLNQIDQHTKGIDELDYSIACCRNLIRGEPVPEVGDPANDG